MVAVALRQADHAGEEKPVLNRDLWEQLVAACEPHPVRFVRVRGHAGDPENESCDRLAMQAARRTNLAEDPGCET